MKILFFEPYAYQTPHFETCLELVQEHIDKGDDVVVLGCDATLPTCDLILNDMFRYKCSICKSKRKNGLKLIEGNFLYEDFLLLNEIDQIKLDNVRTDFSDLDSLKMYSIDNFDIGYGVASSIISYYRDPELILTDKVSQIKKIIRASYTVYLSIINQIKRHQPDVVYLFNGRFAIFKPAIKACELLNVSYQIHERGSNKNRYAVYDNHMPHNIFRTNELIQKYWNDNDEKERIEISEKFYLDRANAKSQSWISFVDKQQRGKLPDDWNPSKKNIVIFNSSEDEFASIGDEWKNPFFDSQIQGIRHVISCMEKHHDYQVYLRIHPNLSNVNNKSVEKLMALNSKNLTIIPAASKVSTYDLILSCNKIISFGSTAGIEATYWNKPSILLGSCFYQSLNAVYLPENVESIENLLLSELKPKEKVKALMYGFYLNSFGQNYHYYVAETLFSGKFKGIAVEPSGILHGLRSLKKKLNRV